MLTARQRTIVTLIVQGYIESATPISSEWIARNPDLGVSPATIRNDIAELEEMGYLNRPHPSAGTMPQDRAYRLYVGSLFDADTEPLLPDASAAVRRRLSEVEGDLDEWTSAAASALAGLVGNMAIVTIPKAPESHVRHLELVYLRDFLVMLIVVMEQARLRRQSLPLPCQLATLRGANAEPGEQWPHRGPGGRREPNGRRHQSAVDHEGFSQLGSHL